MFPSGDVQQESPPHLFASYHPGDHQIQMVGVHLSLDQTLGSASVQINFEGDFGIVRHQFHNRQESFNCVKRPITTGRPICFGVDQEGPTRTRFMDFCNRSRAVADNTRHTFEFRLFGSGPFFAICIDRTSQKEVGSIAPRLPTCIRLDMEVEAGTSFLPHLRQLLDFFRGRHRVVLVGGAYL